MAHTAGVNAGRGPLPRLLYIGDVAVADTMGGEALLYRLLQFYPPEQLAVVCSVRPSMPVLPGVSYHHYGASFPRLLYSRIAEEYVLWNAWLYYRIPSAIAQIAAAFKPEAILTISHVSGWLAAWQLARQLQIPLHMIAHDDFVYASRFPAWSRAWAERHFGAAYREAANRYCISDTMEESYRRRFGASGVVIYPTHKGTRTEIDVSPRVGLAAASLTFGYGGSLHVASDLQQVIAFAKAASARGHRLIAFTPQHAQLAAAAAHAGVSIDTRAPIPSDELMALFRNEVDCLLLPQSLAEADRAWVAAAFPTKWADYSTLGLPVLAWAPPGSSSERFVGEHPGSALLVTSSDSADVSRAIEELERRPALRQSLAGTLAAAGRTVFSPQAGWERLSAGLTTSESPRAGA